MSRNVICRRPGQYPIEASADQGAIPCALVDGTQENGNAPPLPMGGAEAKRSGGTTYRPLRSLPVTTETPPTSLSDFVVLESVLPANEFRTLISLSLAAIQLHLVRIARLRASKDFEALAREAQAIAKATEILGAMRAGAAAHRLEAACEHGNHAATYQLINELAQACSDADIVLMRQYEADVF